MVVNPPTNGPANNPQAQTGLFDAAQCQRLDVAARQTLGVQNIELMQQAAEAAFSILLRQFPDVRSLSIWCGKGHNGGDGLLLAALAQSYGLRVQCICLDSRERYQGDVQVALDQAERAGVVLQHAPVDPQIEGDVLVDAMLGTGVSDAPRPHYAQAIERLNGSSLPVVSLDVPSGLDVSTGAAPGAVVNAALTITFIVDKVGLRTGAGQRWGGEIALADLGVPTTLQEAGQQEVPRAQLLHWRAELRPPLAVDAYKHSRGHVLVVGGDQGMPGAVLLAASAALRSGAGMVTVASRPEHAAVVVTRTPELMLIDAASAALEAKLSQADLVVLGPGLGRQAWGRDVYQRVAASGRPVLADADALFWLAEAGTWPGGPLYLTPHSAEASRLVELPVSDLERNRLYYAQLLRERFGAVAALLKGPGSVISSGGTCWVCAHGNPGMATAGMGDVLAGVAGGMLAGCYRAGQDADACAQAFAGAVALHSAAGDIAAERMGQISLLASDVVEALPTALRTP